MKEYEEAISQRGTKLQIWYGEKFSKNKSGYWKGRSGKSAHRWVWEKVRGSIPAKMHVHHKDGNKDNNCIANLELLSASAHARLHGVTRTPYRQPEGSGQIAEELWTKECVHCQKTFEVIKRVFHRVVFCSRGCKNKYKWVKTKQDCRYDTVFRCVFCAAEFSASRHKTRKTCSKACSNRLRAVLARVASL